MKIRPFYTYYVAHIIRQYFASEQPTHPTRAYMLNYDCASRILGGMSNRERGILRDVYYNIDGMSLTAKVEIAAERYHCEKTAIWNLIYETERRIAQERELI